MSTLISSSVTEINPSLLFSDGFELSDQTIIPNEEIVSSFVPDENKVELFIYDSNNFLLDSNYNFEDWAIIKNSSTSPPNTDTIELDPSRDLINRGFDIGTLYNVYNFVNYELQSSPENLYFISEISSDRTEIRLKSNFISNEDIASSVLSLKQKIESAEFFDEFYIAFDGNNYNIAINLQLDDTQEQYSVLIKLYDALPAQFEVKDELYIATKVAESKAYQVDFTLDESQLGLSDVTYLRGPNTNLEIKDFVNNSTELKSKSELLSSNSTSSEFNLQSILNRKGVTITPDYSYDTFDEFVHFSSAKKRIENFYYKVSQIESYQNDLDTLNSITGATSASFQVSSSKAALDANIENIIKNFDGYEYYLYYNNSAYAYPKSTTTFPYELYSTGSTEVLEWLGSDVEGSQYYGGILLSASLYDESNQNWLYYTIPEFIRNNNDNDNYIEFTNMVGQHFDELWLYTKAVSEKLNTTNELDKGIPLKMAQDAIRSLGYEGLSNNYNNQDNFIGLTGEDNGTYVPPTGSELITNYIAVNGGQIVNYWNPAYSFLYYVESINEPGFPYAIDDVSKEIYKRLYHNMAYLVKKKGTISGLRQLINIWGVPNTILRINEFGGKNKDNSDDYDYWYNRYSYAFTPVANQEFASASVRVPWMPLERNRIADGEYIVPDSLQFRFKTFGIPTGSFTSQSLVVKKSDGDNTSTDFDFGVALFYTGSATGSYSGSSNNEYEEYGVMRFYISGAAADGGTAVSNDIYLPFFDKGWWSVMLQRNQHVSASDNTNATTYTLYAKNKTYNGWDGNSIGFEGSVSIVSNISQSINEAWNKFGTTTSDGVYIGGFVSGSTVGSVTIQDAGYIFSGSLQEFRYYSNDIPETVFNDFVMNPESIEGNATTGSESSFDIVNFRAPLGNELEDDFTITDSSSFTETLTSFHPAADTSYVGLNTASFVNPATNATSSTYDILYYANDTLRTYSKTNTEVYFLDQPSIGVRNRVTNKIEVVASQSYGNILSKDISIQQNYQINQDYTEDITSLEVAFSPQDEVNDDIIQTFGYGVVSDTLADPRFTSESLDYYPRLRETAQYYFQKYKKGNIYDYIRLIKYFDNSLFKAIKAYVPARTNVNTGIIIKQHMLERNRYAPPSITQNTQLATSPQPAFNTGLIFQNLELTSSLAIGTFEGGTGGVVENFNYTGSPSFGETPISQSYTSSIAGPAGLVVEIEDTQKEFYDGEYSGSEFVATSQDLNPDNLYSPSDSIYTNSDLYYVQATGNAAGIYVIGDTVTVQKGSNTITATVVDARAINSPFGNTVVTLTDLSGNFPIPNGEDGQIVVSAGTGDGDMDGDIYVQYIGQPSFIYNDNNALLNNYNENRDNTYLKDLDFSTNPSVPVNRLAIISGSATPAQTPDSNYTTARIIRPRYEGSRVSSVDYNNYTPASSNLTFINGDTGSWGGDVSYGKRATIDKNPIYFAHFKNSKENREIFDTYTFRIDALIEVPKDPIEGQARDLTLNTIRIDGSNNNLYNVSNTFEAGRKAIVNYGRQDIVGVDYSALPIGESDILQGGLEYNLITTNELNYSESVNFLHFSKPVWAIPGAASPNDIEVSTGSIFMVTASDAFLLSGSGTNIASNINGISSTTSGPSLGIFHSANTQLSEGQTGTGYFVPNGVDSTIDSNYWVFDVSGSGLSVYEDFKKRFLIQRGDEIRVSYISGSFSVGNPTIVRDFTVTGISGDNTGVKYLTNGFPTPDSSLYNKIEVTPDPTTTLPDIEKGQVTRFTVRRRVQADDRVVIYQTPPVGAQGQLTPSSEGYLIPGDLSPTQKRNVLTLINNLKEKNAFKQDEDLSARSD